MLNFRVPSSAVSFRLVFGEFCRAYPLGVDRLQKWPFANDDTRKAVEHLAKELEQSHPAGMLHLFRERVESVAGARIILVRDEREPLEVSPGVLHWAEVEPAVHGIFAFPPLAAERHQIGRDYHLATMYLPADVAEAVRQTWPNRPAVHRVPVTLPALDARQTQSATMSEGTAVKMIVAAIDRGEVRKKEDARCIIGQGLGHRPFERICAEVIKQRPGAWKRGRPRADGK
jgi:hypothetical protein